MALVNYTPTNWNGTQRVTPSSQNKFENGINDCANAINELDETQKDMITEVKMNGNSIKGVNGVADLGNVVTSVQPITGSSAWNSDTSYKVGNYCLAPNNRLYKCIVANTNVQPPNTTYWQAVTLYNLSVAEDELETKVDSMFITREYSVDFTYEAGTIGTRGAQVSTDIQVSGYTPVGVSIVYVASSGNYDPNCFFSSTKQIVFTNAYRASTSAVNSGSIRFEVIYMKN